MRIVGVDLGLKGAIAFTGGMGPGVIDMPTIKVQSGRKLKQRYGRGEIIQTMRVLHPNDRVFIEKALIIPKGFMVQTNVLMARCEEIIIMACLQLGVPYALVEPKEWQKSFGISGKKGDTGDQSIEIAKKLYPDIKFETPKGRKLDGRADALLIAEYGRMLLKREEGQIIKE
jgi:hypothetical protein